MTVYSGDKSPYNTLTWIDTGFSKLNDLLGGGIPTRKITEISGQFSVGKSTLALQIVAMAQKEDMDCLWVDTELSWGKDYSAALGVDVSHAKLLQARFAEEYLDETLEWAENHKDALIVIDSIGGLLPRAEAEKDSSGKVIGGQAKLIATFCRKITPILAINNIALIVLNHNFIDLMSGKIMTSGGAKLGYSKSIWLMLRKASKKVMQGDKQVGEVIEAEIRKQKLADTLKQKCELQVLFGQGFSKSADMIEEALNKGVIVKEGQFYKFRGEKIGRGANGIREALKDPVLAESIKSELQK